MTSRLNISRHGDQPERGIALVIYKMADKYPGDAGPQRNESGEWTEIKCWLRCRQEIIPNGGEEANFLIHSISHVPQIYTIEHAVAADSSSDRLHIPAAQDNRLAKTWQPKRQ